MRLRHAAILLLAGTLASAPAFADDISDQIERALTAYRNHNTERALTALDAAAHALREERANRLAQLLPIAPPGWTADPPETSAVSASMLGGGTSASRNYRMGSEQVNVQITTDSPMLQQMATLLNNQLGASSAVKTVNVNGRSIAYTPSDNGFMTLVGSAIVKVDGNAQTPESALRRFIGAIDFDALEKLTR